jgi:hypothetical protein
MKIHLQAAAVAVMCILQLCCSAERDKQGRHSERAAPAFAGKLLKIRPGEHFALWGGKLNTTIYAIADYMANNAPLLFTIEN